MSHFCITRFYRVGIETRYGLDGTEIESLRGRNSSSLVLGPTELPTLSVSGHVPGGKAAEAWR